MSMIDELRELLKNEYGIESDAELDRAIAGMEKMNIGIFTAPVRKEG